MTRSEVARQQLEEEIAAARRQDTQKLLTVLRRCDELCRIALPKFNWGASALSADAIRLLNEVPSEVSQTLREYH